MQHKRRKASALLATLAFLCVGRTATAQTRSVSGWGTILLPDNTTVSVNINNVWNYPPWFGGSAIISASVGTFTGVPVWVAFLSPVTAWVSLAGPFIRRADKSLLQATAGIKVTRWAGRWYMAVVVKDATGTILLDSGARRNVDYDLLPLAVGAFTIF